MRLSVPKVHADVYTRPLTKLGFVQTSNHRFTSCQDVGCVQQMRVYFCL